MQLQKLFVSSMPQREDIMYYLIDSSSACDLNGLMELNT